MVAKEKMNTICNFLNVDEGSSKEEPSSTVEEVESKSFTDPNSEESDEGEFHQRWTISNREVQDDPI